MVPADRATEAAGAFVDFALYEVTRPRWDRFARWTLGSAAAAAGVVLTAILLGTPRG